MAKATVYFENIQTLENLREQFLVHVATLTDKNKAKTMLNQYVKLYDEYSDKHATFDGKKIYSKPCKTSAKDFAEMIFTIKAMDGVSLELVGRYLWASGNTKENKAKLKEYGFIWNRKRELWMWEDLGTKSKGSSEDTDTLKGRYGSFKIA